MFGLLSVVEKINVAHPVFLMHTQSLFFWLRKCHQHKSKQCIVDLYIRITWNCIILSLQLMTIFCVLCVIFCDVNYPMCLPTYRFSFTKSLLEAHSAWPSKLKEMITHIALGQTGPVLPWIGLLFGPDTDMFDLLDSQT